MRKLFDHPYRVVRWTDAGEYDEELAQAATFTLAEAAWEVALTSWPHSEITIQQGARIMRKGRGRDRAS
tara:strand:- start:113 stop:319 length:207 start_codon:yes stop_codon:yes gene_type:complete